MKFLFGEKDTLKVRMDLKEANKRPYLWPILGKKTRMFDFTASLICAHKEREGGLCGCCAVVENSYSLCWPMAKESPRDWELEIIEIS